MFFLVITKCLLMHTERQYQPLQGKTGKKGGKLTLVNTTSLCNHLQHSDVGQSWKLTKTGTWRVSNQNIHWQQILEQTGQIQHLEGFKFWHAETTLIVILRKKWEVCRKKNIGWEGYIICCRQKESLPLPLSPTYSIAPSFCKQSRAISMWVDMASHFLR